MTMTHLYVKGTSLIDGAKLARLPQGQKAAVLAMATFGEVDIAFGLDQMALALGVSMQKVDHAIAARRVRGATFPRAA
jgi:hypothetical protein